MSESLKFHIIGIQPISTNDMYIPTAGKLKEGNKRRSAFLRKSPILQQFQLEVENYLVTNYSDKIREFSDIISDKFVDNCPNYAIQLDMKFILPYYDFFYKNGKDFKSNDTTNFSKCYEDAISYNLGLDDKYNVDVHLSKFYKEDFEDTTWEVFATMKVVEVTNYKYVKESDNNE